LKDLTAIIYKYKDSSFSWGKFDCCIFTASVVEEFTGRDLPYWKDILNYTNLKESMRTLKKLKCEKLEDLPSVILNTKRKDISEVKLGEPVYYVNEDGVGILGVCNGVRAYFLQVEEGLTARPIKDCLYSWSID
jgi:hypothetical protein